MSRLITTIATAMSVCFASGLFAASSLEPIQATDVDGVTLKIPPNSKATVLFFLLPDCPVCNAHAPEIKRIASEYAKQQVETWIVYVDSDLSTEAIKTHAKAYNLDGKLICDRSGDLVKRLGVTVAPEAVVVNATGELMYRGRIDNLYADYGKRRVKPTEHDLRNALDAVLAGRPVPVKTTKSIGCILAK